MWVLDRNDVRGHEGLTELVVEDDEEDDDELEDEMEMRMDELLDARRQLRALKTLNRGDALRAP